MKKSLIAFITNAIIILSVSAGDNEGTTYKEPAYKTAVIDNSLEFKAERDGYEVKLTWDTYQAADFQYYKIMKSTTNSNPIYPEQSAIWVLDNQEKNEFFIKDWHKSYTYYRVCVISIDRSRTCSNVVKLAWFEKQDKPEYKKEKYQESKDDNKKVYTKEKLQSVKKPKLDAKLALRADTMVKKLVERLEKKHADDTEKQAERLHSVINKLETLNTKIKSENTKALVTYIIEGIKEAVNELSTSEEIEEIFNILEEEK